jgi:hypothetical protein
MFFMKKGLLMILLAVLQCAQARGQGTIHFSTLVPEVGLNAPVWLGAPPPNGPGVGPSYSAALYHVTPGGAYVLPGSLTTFQDGFGDPTRMYYVVPKLVSVPGTPPGDRAVVYMAAWLTSAGSAENAFATMGAAISPAFELVLGGGDRPAPTLPPIFAG